MFSNPQVLAVLLTVFVSSILVQSASIPTDVSNNSIETMEKTENGVLILNEENIAKIIQENEFVVVLFRKFNLNF